MILNLDQIAAESAQGMVRQTPQPKVEYLERLVTKALGVLQAQGVYALLLFLFSRTGEEAQVAPFIRASLRTALRKLPEYRDNSHLEALDDKADAVLKFYSQEVLHNLDTNFLVRDLYEQTLIYGRYGAKAA